MSTTVLRASEVMDWVASLMNDTAKSAYTYEAVLPYLNMAIDELLEELEANNIPITNATAAVVTVTAGTTKITPAESSDTPHYPNDLIEVRSLSERNALTNDTFVLMQKVEFLNPRPQTTALGEWEWRGQEIILNGSTTNREVKIDYTKEILNSVQNENDIIPIIGVKSYLAYKAGSFCAKYIAENESRFMMLKQDADECLSNLIGIKTKASQNIITRRRPFRSAYKSHGWY